MYLAIRITFLPYAVSAEPIFIVEITILHTFISFAFRIYICIITYMNTVLATNQFPMVVIPLVIRIAMFDV